MKKLLVLIIIVLLIYVFRFELLTAYARLFTVNNATQGADIMIIMSGNIDTRPDYAATLYHEGYANRVFLTREKNWYGEMSPYVEARNAYAELSLLESQVPVEYLPSIHPQGSMSTYDEAYDTLAFLKENPQVQHIILVTDAAHSYRVHYAFQKVLKANNLGHLQLEVAAAPNKIFDESNWFKSELGIVFYIQETIKVPLYWLSSASSTLVQPR